MFSPTEKKILQILKNGKKYSLTELAEKVYANGDRPIFASNTIANSVNRISLKCKHYKLEFKLLSEGQGRQGKKVWIE